MINNGNNKFVGRCFVVLSHVSRTSGDGRKYFAIFFLFSQLSFPPLSNGGTLRDGTARETRVAGE